MNLNKIHKAIKGLGGLLEDVHTAYSFTGAIDTTRAEVSVGYGSGLTAETVYTYSKGKKTKMRVSVSHGIPFETTSSTSRNIININGEIKMWKYTWGESETF